VIGEDGSMSSQLAVQAERHAESWRCRVTVRDRGETSYDVAVSAADLARLDPERADPVRLVRASFEFLLEREPKESILRSFDLPVIGRYFPEYETEIRRRLASEVDVRATA